MGKGAYGSTSRGYKAGKSMSQDPSKLAPSGHDEPSKGAPNPLTALTHAAPALAVIVAIAYGCGFVIVSTFLSQYGVFEADFFKPSYLTIGAIFLLINGVFCVFFVMLGLTVNTLSHN